MNEEILLVILKTLNLHSEVLLMLLKEGVSEEEQNGIFGDMDQDIHKFFSELDCYRRKDD